MKDFHLHMHSRSVFSRIGVVPARQRDAFRQSVSEAPNSGLDSNSITQHDYRRQGKIAPEAASLREETEGKLQALSSPRKNGLDSLFKEVRVFKVVGICWIVSSFGRKLVRGCLQVFVGKLSGP